MLWFIALAVQLVLVWFVWQVLGVVREILKEIKKFMATSAQALSDLQAQVAAEQTVEQSAITLLTQLAAQISAANGVSPAAVEAVVAQIKANAATLASAVTANTPVPPAPAA